MSNPEKQARLDAERDAKNASVDSGATFEVVQKEESIVSELSSELLIDDEVA